MTFLVLLTWTTILDAEPPPLVKDVPVPEGAFARLGVLRHRTVDAAKVFFRSDTRTMSTLLDYSSGVLEWDAHTGMPLRPLKTVDFPRDSVLTFSPDLSRFAAGGESRRFRIIDTSTGKVLRQWKLPHSLGHHAQAVSPDGTLFATGGTAVEPGTHAIAVCKVGRAQPYILDRLPGQINRVAFSPDNRYVAVVCWVGDIGEVQCIELESGRILWKRQDADAEWANLLFGPNGRTLVVRLPRDPDHLELWDARTGERRAGWNPPTGINYDLHAFTPDGELLLTSVMDQLRVIEVRSGKVRYALPIPHGQIALAPDGKTFVTTWPMLRRWETATGKALTDVQPALGDLHAARWLEFSPDGTRLASLGAGGQILLWELAGRTPKAIQGKFHTPMLFAADGKHLYAATRNGGQGIGVVDLAKGKQTHLLSFEKLFDREYSPRLEAMHLLDDGGLWTRIHLETDTYDTRKAILAWDVQRRAVVSKRVFPDEKDNPALHLEREPAVSIQHRAGCMEVYDDHTGKRLARWPATPLDGPAMSSAVSPDGRLLATVHARGTILLWRLPEGSVPEG